MDSRYLSEMIRNQANALSEMAKLIYDEKAGKQFDDLSKKLPVRMEFSKQEIEDIATCLSLCEENFTQDWPERIKKLLWRFGKYED
jgi:hypothetical protein